MIWPWVSAVICCICLSLPFVSVNLPPILDLAQQTAQIRLLGEHFEDPAAPYNVQWLGPNKLSYLVLGLAWLIAGAARAGRLAMVLIACSWVAAYHWLCVKRHRSVSSAILGCIFFFNHFVYMGFLNFALGFPVFVLWFSLMVDGPSESENRWRQSISTLAGSFLLYAAHSLWLAAGMIWMVLNAVLRKHRPGVIVARVAGAAPVLLLAAVNYLMLARQGWGAHIIFDIPSPRQLASSFYLNYALGGVRGWLEPLMIGIISAWAILALWRNRRNLRTAVDRPLLTAAVFFLALGLCLPAVVGRTLYFGSRWVPIGSSLLMLAIPAIHAGAVLRRTLAAAVLLFFCAATSIIWVHFEREELGGFDNALEKITPGARLVSLDLYRDSPRIKTPVYFQMYAYAQVLHGAQLNYSFASSPTSLVVYKDVHALKPGAKRLDWHPAHVQPSDFEYFDDVLIHGEPAVQDRLGREGGLIPVTEPDRWRLFHVGGKADIKK